MPKQKSKRATTSVEVRPDVMQRINEFVNIRGGRGMKKELLSRLLTWFADQPGPVKSAVAGWLDEGTEQAYAGVLRTLADELEKGAAGAIYLDANTIAELTASLKPGETVASFIRSNMIQNQGIIKRPVSGEEELKVPSSNPRGKVPPEVAGKR